MEERLKIVLENIKREKGRLEFEKEQLEWQIKNASLMTINGKQRLEKLNEQIREQHELYNRLYWVLEG